MKSFSKYVSLCLLLLTVCSCSSKKLLVGPEYPVLIPTDSISRKYNMQLDFGKNHFSGMLVARRMSPEEVRLLFTTYFGLSVFDFSLRGDTMRVNHVIEPMRKKKVLSLLEMDLKSIFLSNQPLRCKQLGIENDRTMQRSTYYGKYKIGKGLVKASIYHVEPDLDPEYIEIKHNWLRLKIRLDELIDK